MNARTVDTKALLDQEFLKGELAYEFADYPASLARSIWGR
jgi:hypothetical protein